MRHLLLTEPFFPDDGGSVQLFHEIYTRFPPGELVHVLAGDWPGGRELDRTYPLPVTRFNHRRHAWMKPESALLYANLVRHAAAIAVRDRIEVVHAGRIIPEGLVALALRRSLGLPFVFWVHGEEVAIYRRYAVKARLLRRVFGAARAVLASSAFARALCVEAGAEPAAVAVVSPGVHARDFDQPADLAALRARFGVEGKRVLLTVGPLTRRKGQDRVMRALASMRARFPDVVYLVASRGEDEGELRQLHGELALGDAVRFLDQSSRRDVIDLYKVCDVFVMPSRTLDDGTVEGFGRVFLEAAASGRAVVASRSGGVPQLVVHGETGLVVDGDDPFAVEGALGRLLEDAPLRARLGEAGRARAATVTWEAAAARVRRLAEVGA